MHLISCNVPLFPFSFHCLQTQRSPEKEKWWGWDSQRSSSKILLELQYRASQASTFLTAEGSKLPGTGMGTGMGTGVTVLSVQSSPSKVVRASFYLQAASEMFCRN